jgi:hypothetical protein
MSKRVTIFGSSFASAPAFSYLLDIFPNAVKAHSFQLLRSAYAGDVQTARGNTTGDVPFTGNFQDNAELLNIVGAGNGFMPLWYDQSTAAADSTQPTALNQPRVVNGGVVENVNGYPAAEFDGVNDFLIANDLVSHIGGNNAPFTISTVVRWEQQTTENGAIICLGRSGGGNQNFIGLFLTDATTFGGTRAFIQKRSNATNAPFTISDPLSTTDLSVITADFDGTDARLYVNGQLQDSQNIVGNYSAALNNCNIGRRFSALASQVINFLGSPLLELTVWPFSQFAAGNIAGVNDNIKSRYGIT